MKGDTISRSALLEKAWDADTQCGYVQVVDVGDVEEASAVEPEPVVHGRWMKTSYGYVCSECKSSPAERMMGCRVNRHYEQDLSTYCPACGARMDGGE